MRVVVTGGAGFIGRHVVAGLRRGGHDVVTVDSLRADVHPAEAAVGGAGPVVDAVADTRDLSAMRAALTAADAVVHLAAKVGLGVDVADMDDYVGSNDLGTAVILRAAAEERVGLFVQASSMVVYGEGRYDCAEHGSVAPEPRAHADLAAGRFDPRCPLCGETLAPGLVGEDARLDPRNTYAATKVAQEHLAASWARETGGTARSLRLHNVYGPGMPRNTPYAGVAAIFSSALDRNEPPRVFEDGAQRRDFVHVRDVARAFGAALDWAARARGGGHAAYNIGSGTVTTVGGLARELAAVRRGPVPVVTGAYRAGDVRHVTASSERAAAELGWRAEVRLADGLRGLVLA